MKKSYEQILLQIKTIWLKFNHYLLYESKKKNWKNEVYTNLTL